LAEDRGFVSGGPHRPVSRGYPAAQEQGVTAVVFTRRRTPGKVCATAVGLAETAVPAANGPYSEIG
jgi:hypothetical protein